MTITDTPTACAWLDDCRHQATSQIEREIRPGLAVVVDTCDFHARAAIRLGYHANGLQPGQRRTGQPSAKANT